MEKGVIKTKLIEFISYAIIFVIILFSIEFYELHFIIPFFPILFLFDLCLIIGYLMFLRYVLKKKWFECCKNKLLQIKYILLPILLLEILALFVIIIYYTNEILQTS